MFASLRRRAVLIPRASKHVNALYEPGIPAREVPRPSTRCTHSPCVCRQSADQSAALKGHETGREWTPAEVHEASNRHVLMTWGATDAMLQSSLYLKSSHDVYYVDLEGKEYLDFNAGAMCANLGHTVPESIIKAVDDQLRTLPYAYPGVAVVDVRAKLADLLARVVPGDINTFLFPSTGMEANETAIRAARIMTGRSKILTRYRSYHGASSTTLACTGDQRRFAAEAFTSNSHVHFFDPFPYSFKWGETEEEVTARNLQYVRETVEMEGGHTIAAIMLESVTGTNGILKPPPGYLEGIRQICDENGILLICDEVMAGWGRTGRLFGWCHTDAVPDITTAAKGINGAFLPLGMVGFRDHVANHFRKNPITIGSTYNSHPVVLASAYAAVKYMVETDLVGHVKKMESVMQARMNRLLEKHPSVKQARNVGLFGCIDIQKNRRGDFIAKVSDPLPEPMLRFKSALYENGMFTMVRGHTIHTNPPLIIKPEQIELGFDILEKCLPILDNAMED